MTAAQGVNAADSAKARCDGAQSLACSGFEQLMKELRALMTFLGFT